MCTMLTSRNLKVKGEGTFSYRFITDQKTFVMCSISKDDNVESGVSYVNDKAGDTFDLDRGIRTAFNRAVRAVYSFMDAKEVLHLFRLARAEQEPINGVPIIRVQPLSALVDPNPVDVVAQ
jgi:hypothetical protein